MSWTYDRYGNRTAQTQSFDAPPSNSLSFANPGGAQTNRPDGYVHDASGDLTNDGLNALTYDAENRLVTSSGSSYSFDGNNLRVKKVSGGTTTAYLFSGSKVIAEYVNGAAPSSPTREYIYSGSALVAKIEAGTTNYYHDDHLSVRASTDATGTLLGQQGHFPFGESWYASGSTTKWQFTSYERDSESGNDYAMARYHVNRLGRFSSPDPMAGSLGDPQSLNRYAYVRNAPLNLIDPLGLYLVWIGNCLYNRIDFFVDGKYDSSEYDWIGCYSGGGGGGGGGGTLDARANALAAAINKTGVQAIANPCTIAGFYLLSAVVGAAPSAVELYAVANETLAPFAPQLTRLVYLRAGRGVGVWTAVQSIPFVKEITDSVSQTVAGACHE